VMGLKTQADADQMLLRLAQVEINVNHAAAQPASCTAAPDSSSLAVRRASRAA
jgi:hypothetical protein